MEKEELYLQGILREIEELKSKKRNGLLRQADVTTRRCIQLVERYFSDKPEYELSIHKCKSCSNVWEVVITFIPN